MSVEVKVLPLSLIDPPKHRLRTYLGDMTALKASIKDKGLLQTILVRPVKARYEVVGGQRRYMCIHELGWTEVPCAIKEMTDQEAFELSLIENIERETLNPIEEAEAFQKYTSDLGYGSITQLANTLKKSPSFVVRRLELLKNEDVIPMIQTGKLTVSQAEELIGLDNEKASELADIAIKSELSTTQIGVAKRYVKAGLEPEQAVAQVLQFPTLMPKESEHYNPIKVAREGIGLTLKQALDDMDSHILRLPEGEERARYTQTVRSPLHDLSNVAIRLRKQYNK